MKVLVAGGAGFLGSCVVQDLLAENAHVDILDNMLTSATRLHPSADRALAKASVIVEDVVEFSTRTNSYDWIVHMASPASPRDLRRFEDQLFAANVDGSRRLSSIARRIGARYLFVSSSAVYGDSQCGGSREGDATPGIAVRPYATYAAAKLQAEADITADLANGLVDAWIVRPFNCYGWRMRPSDGRVITEFVTRVRRGEPLPIEGDGLSSRSFLAQDDFVAFVLGLIRRRPRERLLNVGSPTGTSLLELAELVMRLADVRVPLMLNAMPDSGVRRRHANVDLAAQVLNWSPRVALERGVGEVVARLGHQ